MWLWLTDQLYGVKYVVFFLLAQSCHLLHGHRVSGNPTLAFLSVFINWVAGSEQVEANFAQPQLSRALLLLPVVLPRGNSHITLSVDRHVLGPLQASL